MGGCCEPMVNYEESGPDRMLRRALRDYENEGNGRVAILNSVPEGVEWIMRIPTKVPNAHLPSPSIRTNPAEQIQKESFLLIVGLRFFLCLSSVDIISTLTQYFAANPRKRPASFLHPLTSDVIYRIYHSLDQGVKRPFTQSMRDYVECITDLRWRRFAVNVYRDYRPENEADPVPAGFIMSEDRERRIDYSQSRPIDMDEIEEWEGCRLCVALRTWIGLRAEEIAQILNMYWEAQPDRRPARWNTLVSYGWIDSNGLITALGVNESLMDSRLAPYGSSLRYGYENVLTQWYWRRRAAVIYSQYPLASYAEPEGRSYMNGEIVGPDPVDPSGDNHDLWDSAREGRDNSD